MSLSTGRDAVVGLAVGSIATPAALAAIAAAASGGAYDDLRAPRIETASDKGLRGHLRAARSGRLSGGAVKVAVIGTGALAAAMMVPGPRSPATVLCRGALIAGGANLVNLFDLRPGRAGKLALLAGVSGIASSDPTVAAASGALTGTLLATLPSDLGETGMLGDLGANALGAVVGLRLALLPGRFRTVALGLVAALTLLSERVSFSRVIETVPALRRLDQLGRT